MSRIYKSISVGEKPVVINVPERIIPAVEKIPQPVDDLEPESTEDSEIDYFAQGQ